MVMRKILLVALTAAAMVGCSENEGFENENTVNRIKFGTVVKTGTRTLVATTENFSKFTVSAYKTTDEMGGTVQLNTGFMDDIEVDKSSGEWKYKGDYYIIRKSKFPPNPERSVQFSGKRTKRSVQKKGCTQHL